jgi:serine/threonine-protein kinase
MTTRDPRSLGSPLPPGGPATPRESTSPLSLLSAEPDDEGDGDDDDAKLARGTHGEEPTKVDTPAARTKPPARSSPLPAARIAPDDPIGRLGQVLGSYRLVELLGKGGMGYVFRAEHVKLGREVALKLLRPDYARRRDAVARFFQEARTVNRVPHRNIVDVTDFVELDDGTTFIIMELLHGEPLGRWARTGIEVPRAIAALIQMCEGLAAAHAVGVIHRDLKPDNVIVATSPAGGDLVKLLDFGVAKLVDRDDEDVGFETAAGAVIGTPAYMSPEQAGGMLIDPRSDLYSLGAIMYELFTGQPMFRGRSFGEFVRKHLSELPPAPSATAGGVGIDPRLEAIIHRCIEKDPGRRFAGMAELRDALAALLGAQVGAPGVPGLPAAPGAIATTPAPSIKVGPDLADVGYASQLSALSVLHGSQVGHTQPPPPRGAPWWVWFAGGALAVSVGVGAATWYAGKVEGPAAEPASGHVVSTPITPPPAATELRVESHPPGAVYADGGSTALCVTPCSFSIDVRDGGAVDRRRYVVRLAGHRDAPFVVDLAGTERAFTVTLPPLAEAANLAIPATGRTPPNPPAPPAADGAVAPASPDPAASPVASPDTPATPATAPAAPADGVDDPAASPSEDPATAKGHGHHPPSAPPVPSGRRPAAGRSTATAPTSATAPPPKKKIDRVETLDPFNRKP